MRWLGWPGACAGCGGELAGVPVVDVQKRQVFEAQPPPPPRVVEYRVVARRCPGCGKVCCGQLGRGCPRRWEWSAFGGGSCGAVTLGHHLPYRRAALVLRQLAGMAVSVGFLMAARRRAAVLL
jgi:transposase